LSRQRPNREGQANRDVAAKLINEYGYEQCCLLRPANSKTPFTTSQQGLVIGERLPAPNLGH
jgi:hypothetical protein